MIIKGGRNHYGIDIGIICLDSKYAKIPGHIRNARTFSFPVLYSVVEGATIKKVVDIQDPKLLHPFLQAARELEREGVRAITGSCGFMALFQKQLADSVNIPVFISSLMQIPLVHSMLGKDKYVGIMVAKKESITEQHLEAVNAANTPIVIAGMDEQPEFCEVIIDGLRHQIDIDELKSEVLKVAEALVKNNPQVGAIIIECTDMSPFARLISQKFNIPVFDIVTLTNMVYQSVRATEENLGHKFKFSM